MVREKVVMKKRMFLALDISDTDKIKIAYWREQHLSLPFKAIRAQNFHITLAFLGLIDEAQQVNLEKLISQQHHAIQQQLQAFLQHNKTLSLALSQTGYFKKAQVLHLMPTTCPDWLLYLNNLIINLSINCNITLENRTYQPHLSLYRKAKFTLPLSFESIQKITIKQQLSITSFSLYHSYSTAFGVRYEPVQRWKINSQ